jgi:hypothetical protein
MCQWTVIEKSECDFVFAKVSIQITKYKFSLYFFNKNSEFLPVLDSCGKTKKFESSHYPLSINRQKALRPRGFQGFWAFILRGAFLTSQI